MEDTFKLSAIPFEEKLLQDNTQLRPLCMNNQPLCFMQRRRSAGSVYNYLQSALRLYKQATWLALQSEIWSHDDDDLMYGAAATYGGWG